MKSFAQKPWFAPQPVLIIGTYNKEGVANAMNAAWAGQWDCVNRLQNIEIIDGNRKNFTSPLAGIGCKCALQVRLRP